MKEDVFLEIGDGDTATIQADVRMVSIDTPEKEQDAGSPPVAQAKLDLCKSRLLDGTYKALPRRSHRARTWRQDGGGASCGASAPG
ncbi:hypothetical protein GCM10010412_074810 [Nonomuraea recticatena]|uniref:Uncharacterized protein n=1 Tax=Nonomuraea recticatena TaxID=46178 RepID=A0ABN3SVI6_9ACTN